MSSSRYKSTRIKKDKFTGNRVLKVTEYPKVTSKETDIIYYTKDYDSYMSLAYRFYNDQSLWWVIARANSPFKGKFKFEAGTKLIIPTDLNDFFSEHNLINTTRDMKEPK
jgi:nucleoid-associated protein YgaU